MPQQKRRHPLIALKLTLGACAALITLSCSVGEAPDFVPSEGSRELAQRHPDCGPLASYIARADISFCIDSWPSPGFSKQPELVRYEQAEARCDARGWRLCTEREWELACRGPEGWRYPYGQHYEPGRCVTGGESTRPAGELVDCRSAYGLYDMSGNVAEWVQGGLLRGGDATGEGVDVRCAARARSGSQGPTFTGSRCCLSLD